MDILYGFLYGMLGGLFAETLRLFRLRHLAPARLPDWLRSWFYWLATLAMITAGGILVVIYLESGISFQPIVAVNIGASAPYVIGSLVEQVPLVEPGRVD